MRRFSLRHRSSKGQLALRLSLALLGVLVGGLLVGCSILPTPPATLESGSAPESSESPAEEPRYERQRAKYLGPSIPLGSEIGPSKMLPSERYTGRWESLGPANYAGKVYDLSASATDADVVAAAYGPGGLWMTRDGGLQWERLGDPSLRNRFASVHLWQGDHDVIFGGMGLPGLIVPAEQGIVRSMDGGATWARIGPDIDGAEAIYRIVTSPTDADRIWAASTYGVYRTVDGGATWQETLTFPNSGDFWQYLPDLTIHPHDPSILWAAHRSVDVMKSVDGGQTWQPSASGFPVNTGAVVIAVHAASDTDPGTLYAVEDAEVEGQGMMFLKSTDGGASWTLLEQASEFDQGRYDQSVAVDPSDPDHVLIGNVDLYRSTDGQTFDKLFDNGTVGVGANEGEVTTPAPHVDYLRNVFSPVDPDVVWSGNDGGLYRSVDGGLNWWKTDRGVTSNLSFGLGVDQNSDALYLTSLDWNRTLEYRGGQDWSQFNGYEQQFFSVDPVDSDILYTAFGGGVQRSTDRGVSWTNIDPEPGGLAPPGRPFRFDPRSPEIIYATTDRVYRSPDRGATWQAISPALGGLEGIVDLAISDKDPAVLVAITNILVWRTTDGGGSWSAVGAPPENLRAVAFVPGSTDSFTVVAASDILRFENGGGTQASLRSNLPTTIFYEALHLDPTEPDRLILGTANGVYVSDDDGVRWNSLGVGLPPVLVSSLGLRDGFVVAATQQGAWRYDLSRSDGLVYNDFVDPDGLVFPPTVSPQLQQAVASEGMLLLPDASQPGDQELDISSGVWTRSAPLLREGFEARFRFRLRDGADDGAGLAFVIQNEGNDAYGNDLGYSDIDTSLAIEIDPLADDLAEGPHVSIQSNGAAPNSASIASSLAYAVLAPNDLLPNRTHEVRIDYRPGWIEVFLDDLERAILVHELDLSQVRGSDLLDAAGRAWVGLTGQKAAFVDGRYEILSFSLRPSDRRFHPLPGARAHWRMDDAVGTAVTDSSGNDHHGTAEGGPSWDFGRVGGGLVLDGADDLVRFGTGPALYWTTDFTLSAWVKSGGSGKMTILQQRDEESFDGEYYLFVQPDTGVPVFGVYGADTLQFEIAGTLPVNDGRWHHIAAGRASTEGFLWVDGELDGMESGRLTAPLDSSIEVVMGADVRDGDGFFDGVIDDVRIYDVLLSEDQIGQIVRSRPLTVELAGNGSGTVTSEPTAIDCGTVCSADLPIGWSTRLVAVADEGSGFAGWSGACRGGDADACYTYDWSQNGPAIATFVLGEEPGPPASHWQFDEGAGSVAEDSSGNDHPGTISGADWVPGVADGTALDFDGVDDVVTFGTGPALAGTTDFTISAWIRSPGMVGDGVVIQQRNGDFDGQYQLRIGAHGRPVFLVYGGGALQFEFPAQESVTDGSWHHVAAVRHGGEGRIYIDGGLSGSALGPVQPLSPLISVAVGADIRDGDAHFLGQIDDVRVFDSALTPAQIVSLATPTEPVDPLEIFSDGFESGDTSQWSN